MPETTAEAAKADLEKQIGRTLTVEEFDKMLPSTIRVVDTIHIENEVLDNPRI